jgi:peptide deformylase
MAALGIAQLGDRVLTTPTRHFELPAESVEAGRIAAQLAVTAGAVERLHPFGRGGMGIAAPQLGVSRAIALYRPTYREQILLVNPVVVDRSGSVDEWYEDSEGCLSFFDYRGLVSRPRMIVVEHQSLDGITLRTTFRQEREARDVMHEIDHLNGILYPDRMSDPTKLLCMPE